MHAHARHKYTHVCGLVEKAIVIMAIYSHQKSLKLFSIISIINKLPEKDLYFKVSLGQKFQI